MRLLQRIKLFSLVIVLTVVSIVTMTSPVGATGTPDTSGSSSSRTSATVPAYTIDNYDVDITVNQFNRLHIEETIKATFHQQRHGIVRSLAKVNHVARMDGSKSTVNAKISNLKVLSHRFTTSESSNFTNIKIGDPSAYAKTNETYRLSYDYDLGTDQLSRADEFYFNIIGAGWNTGITKVDFHITMPEEFNGKPGFSTGAYGMRSGSDIVEYSVKGKEITGRTTAPLAAEQALTIRLELPQGYFKEDPLRVFLAKYVFVVPIVVSVITLIASIFVVTQEKYKITPVVQYTAPGGLNSLEVAFADKGEIKRKSAASMVVYLANKGYLTIDIDGENFTLTKLKDYDGQNESERIFMNGLFNNDHPNKVAKAELEGEFYTTVYATISTISRGHLKTELFTKKNPTKTLLRLGRVVAMAIILACACFAATLEDNPEKSLMLLLGSLSLLIVPMALMLQPTDWQISAMISKGFGILIFLVPVFAIGLFAHKRPIIAATTIAITILTIGARLTGSIKPRTKEGYRVKGEIMGFKEFIEIVDKPRLEALLAETPTLFYDVIPYAYVLGVHKKWVDKFEGIALQPADWYDSSEAFSYSTMADFVTDGLSEMSTSMASSPDSDSGGFSSSGYSGGSSDGGGGFSGGGSGGGGGSDW
ncbi:DUF2207 domain-containing protein [Candidatus Nanoperiomorbus periodonticus]|uniref:DUF2207 domain-containing protein n=1 Tax=Candidatus Nanoperiomorbus periodonticus TaxID=2171989 RepID=UPI00101C0C20|nr:DUF2207 domain-containing protein [Candidatus Nanoperiomorbus periodonticus]RYC75767.1 hypothetical protein G52EAM_00180 [Candidatus Nanoperiomorbus periodonticus]